MAALDIARKMSDPMLDQLCRARCEDGALLFALLDLTAELGSFLRRWLSLRQAKPNLFPQHRAAQHTHRLEIGPAWEDHGFVFTNATGAPLHTNALIGRFERLIRDTDLPRIRFHDLRHTSATLHLARKTQPKVVQELLGHSNISMTLDRYSHVTETMQRDAAAAIDELIDAAKSAAS